MTVSNKSHQGGNGKKGGWGGIERKLSEGNTKAVYRGQNELIGKFEMAVGDLISIGKYVIAKCNIFLGILQNVTLFPWNCEI